MEYTYTILAVSCHYFILPKALEDWNKRKQVLLDPQQTTSGLFAMLTDTPLRVCITSVVALLDGEGGMHTPSTLEGACSGLGLG